MITNLIYSIVKFLLGILALVFGFIGMVVLFVLALPLVGWSKAKGIFKKHTPSPSQEGN